MPSVRCGERHRGVEVAGGGGSVDAELGGELAEGGAGLIRRDQVVDVGGGEASLGRV